MHHPVKLPEPKDEDGRSEYLNLRDIFPAWHVHDGYTRLFIVGAHNQPDAWFPVTAADLSTSRHGTEEERSIAQQAVAYLILTQRDNPNAGPVEIREALERFGWVPNDLTNHPET